MRQIETTNVSLSHDSDCRWMLTVDGDKEQIARLRSMLFELIASMQQPAQKPCTHCD